MTTEFNAPPSSRDTTRVNQMISAQTIRLVDDQGEMVGVVTRAEGLRMAEEAGLDLVEISPNAVPPVCKILDYGKYKYEVQKRKAEAKKKQTVIEIKEIKIRPGIDENDYQVKLRNAIRFLEDGDKVKVTLRFRGREMSHQELGVQVLDRFREDLAHLSKVEQNPKMEGKQMIMVLVTK